MLFHCRLNTAAGTTEDMANKAKYESQLVLGGAGFCG